MATTIDFRLLTFRVPQAEIDAYQKRAKASGAPWAGLSLASLLAILIGVPVALFFGATTIRTVVALAGSGSGDGLAFLPIIAIVAFLGLALFMYLVAKRIGRWEVWARMDRFARANGLSFSPLDADPDYPGAIFGIGDSRQAVDHVRSVEGRFFDFGNYRYTTGSGKNRSTRTWGFLAFHLDRRLPHMVLDSKANNGFFGSNLPATFDKQQILSLEGDFDRYFTLYCPQQYERDALYVFTPDLMALLIDEAAPFDVEIIDDWMFVYSNTGFPTGDYRPYARLVRIMDTVGAKTLTQTDRYGDERVGDFAANVVAPHGARLKRRVSVGAIIFTVIVVGFWIWGIVGDGLTTLLR
jgi:hypothetical protein